MRVFLCKFLVHGNAVSPSQNKWFFFYFRSGPCSRERKYIEYAICAAINGQAKCIHIMFAVFFGRGEGGCYFFESSWSIWVNWNSFNSFYRFLILKMTFHCQRFHLHSSEFPLPSSVANGITWKACCKINLNHFWCEEKIISHFLFFFKDRTCMRRCVVIENCL